MLSEPSVSRRWPLAVSAVCSFILVFTASITQSFNKRIMFVSQFVVEAVYLSGLDAERSPCIMQREIECVGKNCQSKCDKESTSLLTKYLVVASGPFWKCAMGMAYEQRTGSKRKQGATRYSKRSCNLSETWLSSEV
ncbi:unnamed protein product [Soboliphyme baturini]|uniref:DB domain-containing protein n=1 Tax=Soboliphyme baturini TaxID=241478 RepID=A0A183IHX6_9BILA|nr:unnamed protein product [Soboliphyme baturini]